MIDLINKLNRTHFAATSLRRDEDGRPTERAIHQSLPAEDNRTEEKEQAEQHRNLQDKTGDWGGLAMACFLGQAFFIHKFGSC